MRWEPRSMLLAIWILMGLVFASCEKDKQDLILGKWNFDSYNYSIIQDQVVVEKGNTSGEGMLYLEFFDSGTVDIGYDDGDKVTMDWRIQGDSLFMTYLYAEMYNLEIRSLDKKELVLADMKDLEDGSILEQILTLLKDS